MRFRDCRVTGQATEGRSLQRQAVRGKLAGAACRGSWPVRKLLSAAAHLAVGDLVVAEPLQHLLQLARKLAAMQVEEQVIVSNGATATRLQPGSMGSMGREGCSSGENCSNLA